MIKQFGRLYRVELGNQEVLNKEPEEDDEVEEVESETETPEETPEETSPETSKKGARMSDEPDEDESDEDESDEDEPEIPEGNESGNSTDGMLEDGPAPSAPSLGTKVGGIQIETLRVRFDFEKSNSAKPNIGKVIIYNLNPTHRREILSKQYANIRVSVGYHGLRMIFLGNIIRAAQKREGLDWVIEIECADGDTDYLTAYTALTIAAGSTDKDVVEKVAGTFEQTTIGEIVLPEGKPLPRGKVLFGNTRDILNQVVKNTNSDWSIQDGELVVLPPEAVRDDQAVAIDQSTGMIGSPEQTDNGLVLKCLLNPSLKVGGLVQVRSIDSVYDGDYKIVNLKCTGDTHADEWFNELTVVGGQFVPVKEG